MNYYIYGLADPRDNKIKYVGKGCGNRMFAHIPGVKNNHIYGNNYTKFNALKEILTTYEDIAYCKLFETDDELLAYEKEKEFIEAYNTLIPNGWNISLGGVRLACQEENTLKKQKRKCL